LDKLKPEVTSGSEPEEPAETLQTLVLLQWMGLQSEKDESVRKLLYEIENSAEEKVHKPIKRAIYLLNFRAGCCGDAEACSVGQFYFTTGKVTILSLLRGGSAGCCMALHCAFDDYATGYSVRRAAAVIPKATRMPRLLVLLSFVGHKTSVDALGTRF
jgi:hypothetical protein